MVGHPEVTFSRLAIWQNAGSPAKCSVPLPRYGVLGDQSREVPVTSNEAVPRGFIASDVTGVYLESSVRSSVYRGKELHRGLD
jgi:hypothetical protein